MKILHVITSLRAGGAERLVSGLLPFFRKDGIEVELAVFDGSPSHLMETLLESGIKIHIFGHGSRSMYNPVHIFRLRRLMQDFDIVHTHNTPAQFFAAVAAKKGQFMVTTEHSTDNRRRHLPLLRVVDRMMFRRYDAIVCCSNVVRKSLLAYLGQDFAGSSHVIENGIDLRRFSSDGSVVRDIDIVMVAAFRPPKDHITPLKALKFLPDNIAVSFAGDGVTRAAVEACVREMGLEHRVRFLGAVADVPGLLSKAKIALLSTNYEGFGLSCVEAMAAGTPLVASDVAAVREVCGDAAMLFPPADHVALADILRSLLESQAKRDERAEAGLMQAAKFDIGLAAVRYAGLYRGMTNGNRSGEPFPAKHTKS